MNTIRTFLSIALAIALGLGAIFALGLSLPGRLLTLADSVDTASSPTVTTGTGALTLYVGEDSEVDVPFELPVGLRNVDPQNPVGVVQTQVDYQPEKLVLLDCTPSDLFEISECGTSISGTVKLAAIASPGIEVDGLIATLRFTRAAASLYFADLSLSAALLVDEEANPLAHTVENAELRFPLPCPPGDVDCDGSLTMTDRDQILEYDSGLRLYSDQVPPPANSLVGPVCDLSQDGRCNVIDGLFVQHCLNDPAGSLCPIPAPRMGDGQPTARLAIGEIPVGAPSIVAVPISVTLPFSLHAATIDVHYPTGRLQVESCEIESTLFEASRCNPNYSVNSTGTGTLRLNFVSTPGFSGRPVLAQIQFRLLQPIEEPILPGVEAIRFVDERGSQLSVDSDVNGNQPSPLYLPLVGRTQ